MFELQVSICDRFPSLSPFKLRKTTFHELCVFIRRMNGHNKRENKREMKKKNSNGKTVIRRPATDDSWY